MAYNDQSDYSLGYQQITNLSASTALTIPNGTRFAIIQCEAQAVRWRDDGTAPTATVGYPLSTGQELTYTAQNMAALRFIEQTASAKLNIVYFR